MESAASPTLLSPERSQQNGFRIALSPRGRRVPSPLRYEQFRPLAMEYAASASSSPTVCKYFPEPLEEMVPGETINPGGFCAAVRTVGYSTVGEKQFMSGKCPHCNRPVKSPNQVCTPGVTPPPFPWKTMLQSSLRSLSPQRRRTPDPSTSQAGSADTVDEAQHSPRSPARSRGGRSPLRSPFRGSFFGTSKISSEELSVQPQQAARSRTMRGRSHSPMNRGRSSAPWDACMEQHFVTPQGSSPRPARRLPNRNSPCVGSAHTYHAEKRDPMYVNVEFVSANNEFPPPNHKHKNYGGRSKSPTTRSATSETQSARSDEKPMRSRSPLKSFSQTSSNQSRLQEQQQQTGYIVRRGGVGISSKQSQSRSPVRGGSVRGTSSPGPATRGPRSPIPNPHKRSFFDDSVIDADDEIAIIQSVKEEIVGKRSPKSGGRVERSQSPLRSPLQSPFSAGRLRSPVRSPFNASFFGGGRDGDASYSREKQQCDDKSTVTIGSE